MTTTNDGDASTATTDDTGGSLLTATTTTDTTGTAVETTTTDDPNAWLPEKFRVMGEGGALDEAASARKLADSYRALEAHKGPLPTSQAPETPEAYELKVEGLEGDALEQFKGDPMFQDFAKSMHEAGLSNDQLNAVVARWLQAAPQLLAANEQLSLNDAKGELAKVWTTEAAMSDGIASAMKAIQAFGGEGDSAPGSRARLQAKYATDPDFVAFAASIGKEMKEDVPVNAHAARGDGDIESLQKSEAYWNEKHPDHTKVKAQVSEHYARKFGTTNRR